LNVFQFFLNFIKVNNPNDIESDGSEVHNYEISNFIGKRLDSLNRLEKHLDKEKKVSSIMSKFNRNKPSFRVKFKKSFDANNTTIAAITNNDNINISNQPEKKEFSKLFKIKLTNNKRKNTTATNIEMTNLKSPKLKTKKDLNSTINE
jgi:hypothetical protein